MAQLTVREPVSERLLSFLSALGICLWGTLQTSRKDEWFSGGVRVLVSAWWTCGTCSFSALWEESGHGNCLLVWVRETARLLSIPGRMKKTERGEGLVSELGE